MTWHAKVGELLLIYEEEESAAGAIKSGWSTLLNE
jgi:hypothetical protein